MTFSLLDFLFPKRCVSCGKLGSYICRDCYSKIEFIDKPVCPVCERQAIGGRTHPGCRKSLGLDGLVVASRYQGPIREAIKQLKYRFSYDLADLLIDLLAGQIWMFDLPGSYILVPVPLHFKRKNWRGFNQAELLAGKMAKKFTVKYFEALIRIRETRPQVGLMKKERIENVRSAFDVAGKNLVVGKNVILVDDVFTSGSTMKEACRVLKRAGADEVWAMAVALG